MPLSYSVTEGDRPGATTGRYTPHRPAGPGVIAIVGRGVLADVGKMSGVGVGSSVRGAGPAAATSARAAEAGVGDETGSRLAGTVGNVGVAGIGSVAQATNKAPANRHNSNPAGKPLVDLSIRMILGAKGENTTPANSVV